MKKAIETTKAPAGQGTYTQAIATNGLVFLSGQIPINPETQALVSEDIHEQVEQVFKNLQVVCEAAGGKLDNIVKLQVYLVDLKDIAVVNEVMGKTFQKPYPARSAFGNVTLARGALVEIDAIMVAESCS